MIKVFIIDDTILIRNTIRKILKNIKNLDVIGEAPNPIDAFECFKKVGLPDVFILDIEMPKMDGIEFLYKMKEQKQIPTIICSSVTKSGSKKAIQALELGACDIIEKSYQGLENTEEVQKEFKDKIYAATKSKFIKDSDIKYTANTKKLKKTNKIIAIGASTGGVHTLEKILISLHKNHSPIVITQHMPEGFTKSFSQRLNSICENSYIKEASNGDKLLVGQILIAPGDYQMELKKVNEFYEVFIYEGKKVSGHRPSVDVLFSSIAKVVSKNAVAILLTGMGSDGAKGLKEVSDKNGRTYGQDEETSVVYGMPRVAFELGAVQRQVSIDEVASIINQIE